MATENIGAYEAAVLLQLDQLKAQVAVATGELLKVSGSLGEVEQHSKQTAETTGALGALFGGLRGQVAAVGGALFGLQQIWSAVIGVMHQAYDLTIGLVRETLEHARATEVLALRLGLTLTQARAFEDASTIWLGNTGALSAAMRFLALSMERVASGAAPGTARAFKALGVDTDNWSRQLPPAANVLAQLSRGMAGMESATTRTAGAQAIFGRGAAEVVPLLIAMGAAGGDVVAMMERFGFRADESVLGGLSSMAIQVRTFTAQLAEMKENVLNQIALGLEPAIAKLNDLGLGAIRAGEAFNNQLGAAVLHVTETIIGMLPSLDAMRRDLEGIGHVVDDLTLGQLPALRALLEGIVVVGIEFARVFGAALLTSVRVLIAGLGDVAALFRFAYDSWAELVRSILEFREPDFSMGMAGAAFNQFAERFKAWGDYAKQAGLDLDATVRTAEENLRNFARGNTTRTPGFVGPPAPAGSGGGAPGDFFGGAGKDPNAKLRELIASLEQERLALEVGASAAEQAKLKTAELAGANEQLKNSYLSLFNTVAEEKALASAYEQSTSAVRNAIAAIGTQEEQLRRQEQTLARERAELTGDTERARQLAIKESVDQAREQYVSLIRANDEAQLAIITAVLENERQQSIAQSEGYQQRLAQELTALRERERLIKEHGDRLIALQQQAAEQAAERTKQAMENATTSVIDFGQIVSRTIDDTFEGLILGTRKWSDVGKAAMASLVKSATKGFADIITEKVLGLDKPFKGNILDLMGEVGKMFGLGGTEAGSQFGAMLGKVFPLFGGEGSLTKLFGAIFGGSEAGVPPGAIMNAEGGSTTAAGDFIGEEGTQSIVVKALKELGAVLLDGLGDLKGGLGDVFSGASKALGSLFNVDFSALKETLSGVGTLMTDAVGSVASGVGSLIGGIIDVASGTGDIVSALLGPILAILIQAVIYLATQVAKFWGQSGGIVGNGAFTPSFTEAGGRDTRRTTLMRLHDTEGVLNPAAMLALRGPGFVHDVNAGVDPLTALEHAFGSALSGMGQAVAVPVAGSSVTNAPTFQIYVQGGGEDVAIRVRDAVREAWESYGRGGGWG